ncbi:MAG: GAF domain-containing protein [Bacteroidales bacterium]|nr:GAF domain-containing protein [Bacteroidales bacterium]
MKTKKESYELVLKQVEAILSDETDLIANLANVSALLKTTFHFFWVGFYWVKNNELVLGPFQGPVACTRITKGKGVCGFTWVNEETSIVPDVSKFEGHIACSPHSKSEIVVPLIHQNTVVGVLDIDSDELDAFDSLDRYYLEKICQLLILQSLI